MAAGTFDVTDRPWRQLPDPAPVVCGRQEWPKGGGPGARAGEEFRHKLESTARHQAVFSPEPGPADSTAPPEFKRCAQASTALVRDGSTNGSGAWGGGGVGASGIGAELHRWSLASGLALRFLSQRGSVGFAVVEHWLGEAVRDSLTFLRRSLGAAAGGAGPAGAAPAGVQTGPLASPTLDWHPHREWVASLSSGGVLAVHSLGDCLGSGASQYLRWDALRCGAPVCLAWQPNNMAGTIAVGMTQGVSVWRHSQERGWWSIWSLPGAPFACPAVAWAPDGRCLAAAGARGVVRVWLHTDLAVGGSTRPCVTLWRWFSGNVAAMRWDPDGTLLAVAHGGGRPFVRFWDTRSWEVSLCVSLAGGGPAPSLAWCAGGTLLGAAAGRLFEVRGASSSGGSFAGGYAPACRTLQVPQLPEQQPAAGGQAVLEACVCPKTGGLVAVRLAGVPHVLVFERLGYTGWVKQELALWGVVSSDGVCLDLAALTAADNSSSSTLLPAAIAFAAGGTPGTSPQPEDARQSVLAVYWDAPGQTPELRTYPLRLSPSGPGGR